MTEKKRTTAKSFHPVPLMLLTLVTAAASAGCGQSSNLEQQSQKALNQLLSCTLQQAEDFDKAAAADLASMEAAADGEVGMAQGDDEVRDYFKKRFGDSMTDECIEELAKSRTFYRSIALAKDFGSDIEAGEIEFTKRSDDQECYTFFAEIKTSAGDPVAAAEGTISMEKDGTEWKASQITLTMNETQNGKEQLSDSQAAEIIHDFYQGDYEYTQTAYYKMGTNSETRVDEVEGKLIADPYQQYEQCVNTSEVQGIAAQYWYMQDENVVHNLKFSFTDKPDYWMTTETDIKGNVLYKKDDLSFVFAGEEVVDGRDVYVYSAQYEEESTVDYSELPEEKRNGFTKISIPYMVNLDYYIDPQAKEVVRIGIDHSEGITAGEIANLMFSGMTREEAEREVSENEPMESHWIIMDIKNFNGEIKIDVPEDL